MLTSIEFHYKFWNNLQRSWNIEYFLYHEHEIQKGGPQIVPFHKDFSPCGEQLELRKLAHEL